MNPRITLLMCLLLCVLSVVRAQDAPVLDLEERALLSLINEYRAGRGLPPLRVSQALTRSAEWMTGDMAARNYFDHTDSARRDPFKRMAAFGYGYKSQRGENVAAGFNDAARIFALWQGSPVHNKAMLEANYRVIGLARAQSAHAGLRWVWVADFGSYVDETLEVNHGQLASISAVHGAELRRKVNTEEVAIIAGENLSRCAAVANQARGGVLPTTLCGTTLTVNGKAAPLYAVSPTQIHYVVPAGTAAGLAIIAVFSSGQLMARGQVTVETNPRADLRRETSLPNQLALYGSDLRNCSSLKQVEARVNNQPVKVRYAPSRENQSGLDQLYLELPDALQRADAWQVSLTVDGKPIHPVSLKALRLDDNQRGATAAEGFR